MASFTEIREFIIAVLQPSLPIWALVIVGWKVFPESRTKRMQPETKRAVSSYDESEDMVPLGPMSGQERLKAKAGKKNRLKNDIQLSSTDKKV